MTNQTPQLNAPNFCRAAWIRFLRREGATVREIATALNAPEIEVARHVAALPIKRFGRSIRERLMS